MASWIQAGSGLPSESTTGNTSDEEEEFSVVRTPGSTDRHAAHRVVVIVVAAAVAPVDMVTLWHLVVNKGTRLAVSPRLLLWPLLCLCLFLDSTWQSAVLLSFLQPQLSRSFERETSLI